MTGVRNGPLARKITASSGIQQIGVVPANMTWLVKAVHVLNASSAPADVSVFLVGADTVQAYLANWATIANGKFETWQGWTAAGPGDAVFLFSDQAALHIWVSGAELPGVIS